MQREARACAPPQYAPLSARERECAGAVVRSMRCGSFMSLFASYFASVLPEARRAPRATLARAVVCYPFDHRSMIRRDVCPR